MLKAVLFDMDGVIIDTEATYAVMDTKLCRELGVPMTETDQRKYTGTTARVMWEDIKSKYPLEQSVEELMEIQAKGVNEFYKTGNLMPIEATLQLMKDLNQKGIRCAIATSSADRNAQKVVERLGIQDYIQAVATSSHVKQGKPAPDIFLLAAELLDATPEECIVIEDSRNGCIAGKAAGMKVVGFVNPNSGNQDLSAADILVQDMAHVTTDRLMELLDGM